MDNANDTNSRPFLAALALPSMDDASVAKWGAWLRDTEPLDAKAEMTAIGAAGYRVGRLIKRNGYKAYNFGVVGVALVSLAANRHWISLSVAEMAKASQFVARDVLLAAFGALCLAKVAKIAIQNRGSYVEAAKSGLGRWEAAKRYGQHMGAEAHARAPNLYPAAKVGANALSWTAKKVGLDRAALALAAAGQRGADRSDAFKKGRVGAAKKARLMLSRDERSKDSYREALRLVVAQSLGHFDTDQPKPRASLPETSKDLFDQLAIGFDRAFPVSVASDPAAKINKATVEPMTFAGCAERVAERATLVDADPLCAPQPGMPSLSELMGLLAREASEDPRVDFSSSHYVSEFLPAGEPDSLARRCAPWLASLDAQAIAKELGDPSVSSAPRARSARRI